MNRVEDSGLSDGSEAESRKNNESTSEVPKDGTVERINPWLIAQQSLRRVVDEHSYENWFGQARFESYIDGVLTVQVPSQFFANWLREHYEETIAKTLPEVLPDFKSIRFHPVKETVARNPGMVRQRKPVAARPMKPASRNSSAPTSVAARGNGKSHDGSVVTFNRRYTFDRFVIGASNRFAHAAAKAVVDTPARAYNPLFLYGDTGLGKTHLMHAIGQELRRRNPELSVELVTSELFMNELIESIATKSTPKFRSRYRHADVLLIDDIHFIAGKEATQEEFFHTFNELYDAHKQIVISSDRGPKEILDMEGRLVSRFEWGLVTDIQPPDFETRMAILQNKALDEQVELQDDVTRYIASLVTSNIRELEGALVTVTAFSRIQNQKIDLELVDKALHEVVARSKIKSVTHEQIQKAVAERFDVRIVELRGHSRQRQFAYPRQVAMFLCKTLIPELTLHDIGNAFGGKDHTTVLYACQKIAQERETNESLRQVIGEIEQVLRG
jgi:chromosomal replication initiator protein